MHSQEKTETDLGNYLKQNLNFGLSKNCTKNPPKKTAGQKHHWFRSYNI